LPGEHLVENAREPVNIAGDAHIYLAGCLLGTHVLRCAEHEAAQREGLVGALGGNVGNAEIGEQGVVVGEQNVLRLYIAMHETISVRVIQSGADLVRDAERVVDRQLLLAIEPVAERSAGDIWRHVPERAVGFAGIDQRNDVRMRQLRGNSDLAQESLGADRSPKLLLQDLDGDLTLVLFLLGEVHGRHSAMADQALDRVPVGERIDEGGRRVTHDAEYSTTAEPVTSFRARYSRGRSLQGEEPRARFWRSPDALGTVSPRV